ncbi:hypothetical protein PHYPSEUDO_010923 [Phytophthora pseudosyringae]|uniref:Uncharacterized protein n=1 Tax=Phytophthora pseudosyringae TaxID=221518 RepID=A0A8T1V947_9STRA|nr:hypothetical protein PHYPSEUDO_010923 [Phytophthora pseudosyringae]
MHDVQATDVHRMNVSPDPFELFEGPHSVSSASDAHGRGSRDSSSASSERLDRPEGLLEGMAKQKAQFIANQVNLQEQLQRRSGLSQTPSNGVFGAFASFMKVRDSRMRVGSLDASMPTIAQVAPTFTAPTRPVIHTTTSNSRRSSSRCRRPRWSSSCRHPQHNRTLLECTNKVAARCSVALITVNCISEQPLVLHQMHVGPTVQDPRT